MLRCVSVCAVRVVKVVPVVGVVLVAVVVTDDRVVRVVVFLLPRFIVKLGIRLPAIIMDVVGVRVVVVVTLCSFGLFLLAVSLLVLWVLMCRLLLLLRMPLRLRVVCWSVAVGGVVVLLVTLLVLWPFSGLLSALLTCLFGCAAFCCVLIVCVLLWLLVV